MLNGELLIMTWMVGSSSGPAHCIEIGLSSLRIRLSMWSWGWVHWESEPLCGVGAESVENQTLYVELGLSPLRTRSSMWSWGWVHWESDPLCGVGAESIENQTLYVELGLSPSVSLYITKLFNIGNFLFQENSYNF